MKDFNFSAMWPHEEYGTLVLTTDGCAEVIGDQRWDLNDPFINTGNRIVFDAHGRQGSAHYTISDIEPAAPKIGVHKSCQWDELLANGDRSMTKAIRETGPFASNQGIIGALMCGLGQMHAGSNAFDRIRYYRHECSENTFVRLGKLQRAKSVANELVLGHNTRHPDVAGLPLPFDATNSYGRPESYTVVVNLPGIYRTPAFSLPLLKELVTYDLLSSKDRKDRKMVRGIVRFVQFLPQPYRDRTWEVLHRAIAQF